jgi:hypothetical protein
MRTRCCPARARARGTKVGIRAIGRSVAPQARSKGCGEAKERTRWDRPTCAGSGNSRPATSAKTRAKAPTQMGHSVPGSALSLWRRADCMRYVTRQARFWLRNVADPARKRSRKTNSLPCGVAAFAPGQSRQEKGRGQRSGAEPAMRGRGGGTNGAPPRPHLKRDTPPQAGLGPAPINCWLGPLAGFPRGGACRYQRRT